MQRPPVTTVTDAAKAVGVSAIWVRKLCHKNRIGTLVNPRLRLLTPADMRRLKRTLAAIQRLPRKAT